MAANLPYYGYGRVSKEDRAKDDEEFERSIRNQEEDQNRYCAGLGGKLEMYLFDKNVSGTSTNRPSINQYKELAKSQKFNLVVTRADRLGRGRALLDLIDYFEVQHGVEIVTLANDLADELQRETMAFVSGIYAVIGRLNAKRLMQRKQEEGLAYFKPPFGYVYNKKKEWVIDETKASIVRRTFTMFLEGSDYNEVCSKLGISPKQFYKILKNKNYTGKVFHHHYIKHPVTKEIFRTEEVEFEGSHTPLIDPETFNKVQEKINAKVNKIPKYLEKHATS